MGQDETDAESPGLGQSVTKIQRQPDHFLELVQVDEHGAGGRGRDRRAGQRRLPHLIDHQAPEQRRRLTAQLALGQSHQQGLTLGEDLPEVEAGLGLPEYGSQIWAEVEGTKLVHDRAQDLRGPFLTEAVEPTPEPGQAERVV